jgi:RNA polymerase sigma-70 factor (ECF subfamily)
MQDALQTRVSLLLRLRDPHDRVAWAQFVELYGSLVYGFVRRRGVQDADAADLTQEVFQAVAAQAGRWEYDRRQGTFRGWLYRITRNKLARFHRDRYSKPGGSGGTDAQERLAAQADPDDAGDAVWEQEYQQQLFRVAAEQVRDRFAPATWQAFWQTAVEGRSAAEVSAKLGMSVGAIYVAKSRVLAQLTEEIQRLQAEE